MAGVLGQVAVGGLFADVLFFVVAVAFGGVERDFWGAAGALVTPVVVGNGRDGFVERFCHASSPLVAGRNAAGGDGVPRGLRRARDQQAAWRLDCFVAYAPRNDGAGPRPARILRQVVMGPRLRGDDKGGL